MSLSQAGTLAMIIITIAVAAVGVMMKNVLVTAISVGALGGLVHEVAQSNGKVIMPKPDKESGDFYLGALFGLLAGSVAGLLIAQGLPDMSAISNSWLSQFFLAGLGLKGFSEAIATKRP